MKSFIRTDLGWPALNVLFITSHSSSQGSVDNNSNTDIYFNSIMHLSAVYTHY